MNLRKRQGNIEFGRLIKRYRLRRDLTITQLAEQAGISQASVYTTESGINNIRVSAAFKIASILGISTNELESCYIQREEVK